MMKDISRLPPEERKHFRHCEYCKRYYDLRDLGEVFLHAEGDCMTTRGKPGMGVGSTGIDSFKELFNEQDESNSSLN